MKQALDLGSMSIEEKLQAMEAIWEDLCRQSPDSIPSPEWHGQELAERERLIQEGVLKFSDWDEAKDRLRKKVP